MAEQPAPPPSCPARLAAPIAPPPPSPPAIGTGPAPATATPKEVAALYGKWSKDAASCATEYLLYQPDRSFLFDARTSLASGGTVYYDTWTTICSPSTARRKRATAASDPDQIQQVSFFSTRTGPHPGGPTLVRCPDANPPDRVDWTPSSADRATAIALISEARAQFEAAEAAPGTTQTPEPLRGRWGAKCDLGYLEWTDGLQTSWSTFGGTEKRGISQYKQLGKPLHHRVRGRLHPVLRHRRGRPDRAVRRRRPGRPDRLSPPAWIAPALPAVSARSRFCPNAVTPALGPGIARR